VANKILIAAEATNSVDTKNCGVRVTTANSKVVTVHYVTMPDNAPQTNHDKFYVWQATDPRVPYGGKVLYTFDFSRDEQEGSVSLKPLSLGSDKTYCFGYATGPDPKNVVAACFVKFPPDDPTHPIFAPPVDSFFTFEGATSDSVQVQLQTPRNYKAKTWGSVARLFEGEGAPLTKSPVIASVTFDTDDAQNEVVFDGLTLATGYQYTIGFYTNAADDQWTTLGALVTFPV
jgi:hypothetical protein